MLCTECSDQANSCGTGLRNCKFLQLFLLNSAMHTEPGGPIQTHHESKHRLVLTVATIIS